MVLTGLDELWDGPEEGSSVAGFSVGKLRLRHSAQIGSVKILESLASQLSYVDLITILRQVVDEVDDIVTGPLMWSQLLPTVQVHLCPKISLTNNN